MIRIENVVIDQLSYPYNTLLVHLPEQLENGLVIKIVIGIIKPPKNLSQIKTKEGEKAV